MNDELDVFADGDFATEDVFSGALTLDFPDTRSRNHVDITFHVGLQSRTL
jgi:hypothetical protein